MPSFDYDLIVIGAGAGGIHASHCAAALGKKVAVVESSTLGGASVNAGSVANKLFHYASRYKVEFDQAKGLGWTFGELQFNWQRLLANKNAQIKRIDDLNRVRLARLGVDVIQGHGSFFDGHTLTVKNKTYSAERIIIATGARPFVPEIPGREHLSTSNDVFLLPKLPGSVVVIGGGYIAVELASTLAGFGVSTKIVHRRKTLLRRFDQGIQAEIESGLSARGVEIKSPVTVDSVIQCADHRLQVTLSSGELVLTDRVLCATGRVANTRGLGLENTAAGLNRLGAIKVTRDCQTDEDSIYAIGDVIDRVQLAPVAVAEASNLIAHLYQNKKIQLNYRYVATSVLSQPGVACVGLTESKARKLHKNIRVYESRFLASKHCLSGGDDRTFMKLVVDQASDKVIGIHMVGAEAGEIVQGMAVAMQIGITKAEMDEVMGLHSTVA